MPASLLILLFSLLTLSVSAEPANHDVGDKECYLCHKFIKKNSGFLESSHGAIFSNAPRNSLESRGCEACHGQGARHVEIAGDDEYSGPLLTQSFKPDSEDISAINAICSQCHQGGEILHWSGSLHQMSELACTSCHTLHTKQPQVTPRVCENCHTDIRARLQRSSHMPMREGIISCIDCHNAHGSGTDAALTRPSLNETCYQCHAEKRGPFIWEHAPVQESCTNCHEPHGSNHKGMLKMRTPYLCQSCHQTIFHPSELNEGSGLSDSSISKFMGGKSCINCHSKIHGSTHPSGAALQR